MGCDFCLNKKTLLQKDDIINSMSFGWGGKVSIDQCVFDSIATFIDRGYLRLVNPEDCNCLEHGEKIKINYCPMCGCEIEEANDE